MPVPLPSPLLSLSPLPGSPPRDIIVRNNELRARERLALEVREFEDDKIIRREAIIWFEAGPGPGGGGTGFAGQHTVDRQAAGGGMGQGVTFTLHHPWC